MSATAKSNSPITPAATKSRDWMQASTLELQSGSEDESDILDAKAKERCRRKQVKREEKQRGEEVERRAHEEAEARAREEAERKARKETEHQAREQAGMQQKDAEITARQRALVQEVLKKRMREELETGLVGEVWLVCLIPSLVFNTDFYADACIV